MIYDKLEKNMKKHTIKSDNPIYDIHTYTRWSKSKFPWLKCPFPHYFVKKKIKWTFFGV